MTTAPDHRTATDLLQGRFIRAVVFDWDGTAVVNREADASALARVADELLAHGVWLVVVTGTHAGHVQRQLCPLLAPEHRQRLLLCTNRGSEVFGFDTQGRVIRHWLREATPTEEHALTATAEGVCQELQQRAGLQTRIVYDRLNRRKIDLIPMPEWADPPKDQIGRLLEAVQQRLRAAGLEGGINEAIGLTRRIAEAHGLPDARITSDVKHIEVGLTDKGDSVRWVGEHLLTPEGITWTEVLVAGDEFGPIAGSPGSDDLLRRGAPGALIVSVGREPNGVPEGVHHLGGGPRHFIELLGEVLAAKRLESRRARSAEPAASWLDRALRPPEEPSWQLEDHGYVEALEHEVETRFAVSNGFIGVRGSLEIPTPASRARTFVAGMFQTPSGSRIPGIAWAPDWSRYTLAVDGARLSIEDGSAQLHRRVLDVRRGLLLSQWRHRLGSDTIVTVRALRLASLDQRALAIQVIEVAVDRTAFIQINLRPNLDTSSLQLQRVEPGLTVWAAGSNPNRLALATAVLFELGGSPQPSNNQLEEWSGAVIPGQPLQVTRLAALARSGPENGAVIRAIAVVQAAEHRGTQGIIADHVAAWADQWQRSDVEVHGNVALQHALRFAIYHLISAANPDDERVSIGARALTGDSYLGHVFWDTEIFLLPFYTLTWPEASRALLMYRFHTLPGARAKAARLGYCGALYAWESTDTGDETTPPFAIGPQREIIPILAGTHQHHISADIAYAVWHYWLATGDEPFLLEAGAEIILETSRFWASRVTLGDDERYYIRDVVGPDEYHERVDDNAYTNVLAAWNLERGAEVAALLQARWPERWSMLAGKLDLDSDELGQWKTIAGAMYTGFNPDTGLFEQFAGYADLDEVDLSAFEPRSVPMDVLLGRERTQRSKVIKQADVVLMLALLWDQFPAAVREANYRYYEAHCGHGSSLSPAVHALVAARLGDHAEAQRFIEQTAAIDLDNAMGNASGGIHIAAQGGLWQAVVLGHAGARVASDGLHLDPRVPTSWHELAFRLQWRGRIISVQISGHRQTIRILLEHGDEVEIWLGSDRLSLAPDQPVLRALDGAGLEGDS